MKRFPLIIIGLACLIGSPASAQQGTAVDVVPVTRQHSFQQLNVPATVNTRNHSELSFAVDGRLNTFDVDVGAQVETGQIIARLDQRQINATIESLQAQRQAASATLDDEQQQLDELQALATTDFVAQSELRRARAAVSVATANLAEITARLNERQVSKDYHQLRAPFNGVIAERHVAVGEWVSQSQPAFRLVQTDDYYVDAYLAQRFFTQIDEATEVSVRYEGQTLPAQILTKVAAINENDRTFLLRLGLTGQQPPTVIGAAVTANIRLRSNVPQLTVPQDAVIRYSDGRTSVWTVTTDSQQTVAREQLVDLGTRFNGWVTIGESLPEGTQVVVRGNESLTDGEILNVTVSNDYD